MNYQFHNFLIKKPSKWCDLTNKDMIDELYTILYNWLSSKDELLYGDGRNMKTKFYFLLMNNGNDNYKPCDEYFSLKYSDEIVELFLFMKEVTQSYGSLLFHEKNRTSDNILQFISANTTIIDEYDHEEELIYELNEYE